MLKTLFFMAERGQGYVQRNVSVAKQIQRNGPSSPLYYVGQWPMPVASEEGKMI